MIKPIKRVWVPPTTPAVAVPPPPPARPAVPKQVFGVLPETDVEERDSDSIWAEFEEVYAQSKANKSA